MSCEESDEVAEDGDFNQSGPNSDQECNYPFGSSSCNEPIKTQRRTLNTSVFFVLVFRYMVTNYVFSTGKADFDIGIEQLLNSSEKEAISIDLCHDENSGRDFGVDIDEFRSQDVHENLDDLSVTSISRTE